VHETGRREIIGLDVGKTETEASAPTFAKPRRRDRVDVQLAISKCASWLKAAIAVSSARRGSAAPCTACAISGAAVAKASDVGGALLGP
jgi:hypothetical protein